MKVKEKPTLFNRINKKFHRHFGFYIQDVSFDNIVGYMHSPRDSSSLAVTRMLFGMLMLFDIAEERGGSTMDWRWGNPHICHFPLFPFLWPMPMPYMALVYAALWIGALGIMLGYKYRPAAAMFTISYWYLFLIEKSYWNNHGYLFGLVALLFTCTDAGSNLAIDTLQNPTKLKPTVPYWNYFILKYQFFILYFMAGLKKGTTEWLTGYSVPNLSEHWVFTPLKLFLSEAQIDYLIVHWFVFVFDLTVSFWMMCSRTRNVAVIFCCLFHLMNVRLFRIGMFPWVCLATIPLFYPFDWPKTLARKCVWYHNLKADIHKMLDILTEPDIELLCDADTVAEYFENVKNLKRRRRCVSENIDRFDHNIRQIDSTETLTVEDYKYNKRNKDLLQSTEESKVKKSDARSDCRERTTMYLILFYVITQAFLPYSHFITKGFNNWTDGLYGYSWDMMVHTWETSVAHIIIEDHDTKQTYFLDSAALTPNDRWSRHGDMLHQFARCLKQRLENEREKSGKAFSKISIYADVWCSMNGRFTQRLFDKNVDLLQVEWSPFREMPYVMPLLDEAVVWRERIEGIRRHVYSWNNNSDVIFQADFPDYDQNKYVDVELTNATLTVLEGVIAYQTQDHNGFSHRLSAGDTIDVDVGIIHNIYIVGNTPAYYMYTFFNTTQEIRPKDLPKLEILAEFTSRFNKISLFGSLMWKTISECLFNVLRFFN